MVEKMSSDSGNSRASDALQRRHESIKKWKQSDTAKEPNVRHENKFTIQFDKGTVFLSAVASGDVDETAKLIKGGVDIDHTNVDGLTALHQVLVGVLIHILDLSSSLDDHLLPPELVNIIG